MRRIHKRRTEPPELLAYRKSPDPNRSYEAFPSKDALRSPLLEDQGHLCCYCMRRLHAHDMKIEHYRSQSNSPDRALDWHNLLAACPGGEGQPRASQTCDTRKGSESLTIDPQSDSVDSLRFLANGRIQSSDSDHGEDIERRLNLNEAELMRARAQALDNLRRELTRRFGRGSWRRRDLEQYLTHLRDQRPFPEFLGVYEFWLSKKLARLGRRAPPARL